MIHDFYLTYDHTLNAELLRACFFSPKRTWWALSRIPRVYLLE